MRYYAIDFHSPRTTRERANRYPAGRSLRFPAGAGGSLYRADTTGPRFYLDLPGAGHLTPYQGGRPPEPIVARVTTDFLDRYLAGQRSAGAAMRRAGDVTGLADLVHGKNLPP